MSVLVKVQETATASRRVNAWCMSMVVAVSIACSDGDHDHDLTTPFFDHSDLEAVALRGEEFETSSGIGLPTQIYATGDLLWVVDASRDPTLHVVTAEGKLLISLGRKGAGPGEIAGSPRNLYSLPSDPNGVWTFDPDLGRLMRFEARRQTGSEIKAIRLNSPIALSRAFWVGEKKIVGISFISDSARFVFFDPGGNATGAVYGPFLGSSDIPYEQRQRASSTGFHACIRPDGEGFAILYFVAGRIERYDSAAVFRGSMKVPYPSDALFERDPRTDEIVFRNPRQWYKSCGVTRTHLYALFSGRLDAVYGPEAAGAEFVHVFDWDGNLRKVFHLDRPVTTIAVDSSGTTIFGMSHLTPGLVRFRLPSDVNQ